jgi:hypothetical protein
MCMTIAAPMYDLSSVPRIKFPEGMLKFKSYTSVDTFTEQLSF